MDFIEDDILAHYGMKYRSGRYPWGSGGQPYQHSGDFLSRVEELSKNGISQVELAKQMGMSTTELRMQLRVAKHERKNLDAARAQSLRDDGKSYNEIANIMGYKNESSIRSLLNEGSQANRNKARMTADVLKKEIEKKGMLDVGVGVERQLGVSPGVLQEALFILRTEGYEVYGMGIQQVNNPGKQSNTAALCMPGTTYKEAYNKLNAGELDSVGNYHSSDNGKTFNKLEYPSSINSDRVGIRYGDIGGVSKDGVIEIRRGVNDLDLGNSHYAQVRILVDGSHYLKGMAMYSDDIPDGVDIMFNTNKKTGTAKTDVFKPIGKDPDNPFGAYIKADGQSKYKAADGTEKLSAINKLKEEGDWDSMARNLSSQFLSKQPMKLIKTQLDLTYADAQATYDEIKNLNNPTVKRKMLIDFADGCDAAAVHLKAASLPRQRTQVILPITSMKENEVYAPNFKDGETVALVRYPHGGTFEIPVLTVNNKNKGAQNILGKNIKDAIGINAKVAERLSGADFDGDQVAVIPINNKVRVKSTPPLKALVGFNAKDEYAIPDGNPKKATVMTKANTQKQMGMISNLITDMTLKGAPESELARAVKHSMVVIDAAKHKLDYKQSEKDNGIAALKKTYQGYTKDDGTEVGGASTLLSRRKQTIAVPERQGSGRIDKETGKVIYNTSGRTYVDKTGKRVPATTKVHLINEVDDVRSLSSGTPQENAYADYANKMKTLANSARKEYTTTGRLVASSSAKETYKAEVTKLNADLNIALMNAPRERKAQALANSVVKAKKQDNPAMDKEEQRKIGRQELANARYSVGASGKDTRIEISDRQWEAIQAGAITDTQLTKVLRYTDPDAIKQRATPRTSAQLSPAKANKLKTMKASGYYTNEEIAQSLGVPVSTINNYKG